LIALVGRRARHQWPLLAALLAVVTIGATLLGTCALLVTRTGERALEVVAARADPEKTRVTAFTVDVKREEARSVATDTRALLETTLDPFPTTTAARASSAIRSLPSAPADSNGTAAETYLSAVDDLPARAQLVDGRWPRAPGEAVILESTARILGLSVNRKVSLGPELRQDPAPALDVTVVGIARPLAGTGWDRDPLAGAGYDFEFQDGRTAQPVHAYGPFLVALDDLLAGASTVDRLEITARPDLGHASRRDLDAVTHAIAGADRRLDRTLGDRVRIQRVESFLPATLRQAREQQRVTAAAVLAVALVGCVLTATALALAGRLTAGVRTGETALLSALGVSRNQFALAAAAEALALAALAAAVAVPASAGLHSWLTHRQPLAGAGLAAAAATNGAQVAAVVAGALALAAVLVVMAVRPAPAGGQFLVRSGIDVLLVAFAAVGWWQLTAATAQPSGARADVVRVAAPALLLTAGAALALRSAVPVLTAVDRVARRSRGLALPLAAFEAARRPHTVAAGLLISLACAAGTFGTAFDATWQRSQRDQADVAVGTDLALSVAAPPAAGDGAAVGAASGGVVSPAMNRGVAVGQWVGGGGAAPRLVAVDTARSAALLRGRVGEEQSWTHVGAGLSPEIRAVGVPVPGDLTIAGTATGGVTVLATPRLLLQDDTGVRTPCAGPTFPLDGTPLRFPSCAPGRLVAVFLALTSSGPVGETGTLAGVTVTLSLPAAGPDWTAFSAPPDPQMLTNPAATATATTLTLTADARFYGFYDGARTLVATAFGDPGPVPVAVSARFAADLKARTGSRLSLTVGTTPVPVVVASVVPSVPGAPGAVAVLADIDLLSRAVIRGGDPTFPMDAWWVGHPRSDAPERLADLHLGTVVTRAGETARLTGSPPRAGLPAALRLLVPAAALLLFAGVALHVTFDLRARALEVARLRGLGVSRREIRTILLGQHLAVLLPPLLAGALVGALATYGVAPPMIRSDSGAVPVPPVVPLWPWTREAVLVTLLLAGCLLAVTVVATIQSRTSDAARLRVTS
jgi:hypothetical protein